MQGEGQRRVAANEVRFRGVNEAIERGRWPGEEDKPVGFRCECARLGCNQVIELTVVEKRDQAGTVAEASDPRD
jgi:riboflavin synthase